MTSALRLFALIVLIVATPARADVATEAVADGLRAGTEFAQAAARAEASEGRDLPRLGNPADAALLARLWNVDAALAGRPQSPAGVPGLIQWSQTANAAIMRYFAFRNPTSDPVIGERNAVTYQREEALGFTFQIRLLTTAFAGAKAYMDTLPQAQRDEPARQLGIRQMGAGMASIVQGVMTMIGSGKMEPANSRIMTWAIADDLPATLPLMAPETRPLLAKVAATAFASQSDPDVRRDITKIIAILGTN